ncbi:serine hydroxymethyltransferase [Patescibacteria group bacterium]|nr:serine hydroxymethyltransferase [Patescibacteria group bacterium]MBU1931598.1 serine hydroxymethyltransferase [Patescibacteria group bacterium]
MMSLKNTDPKLAELIKKEQQRQQETLMLIPSENYASEAVQQAVGSCLANKYAEGYPRRRYYQGQAYVDQIEQLAIERAKKLFNVPHANVQPYSGSPANAAVYMALLQAGEKIMGMKLSSGGHLTHGHPKITFSGKFFQPVQYQVGKDGWLDYQAIEKLALKHRPKLIITGYTAYPRIVEWQKFSAIAKKVGAWLMADISHIAGLVIAGVHPSPVPYAELITTTTHKTLRGPRGAMILVTQKGLQKDSQLAKKIDRAVFPGLQGGPHLNSIAGIAVCLKQAASANFKKYAQQIVKNAQALVKELINQGFELVTGGTDNHLILIDLRKQGVDGKTAAVVLEAAGLVVNYNTIPYDPNPPRCPSGIRLGTPAVTSRGMGELQMKKIAHWFKQAIDSRDSTKELDKIKKEVKALCRKYPL